uniref:Uncharacterized protein n=1 Tax=Physcomitrium patens TaxID=3218 RepID=A0A7I4A3C2_PHYPA
MLGFHYCVNVRNFLPSQQILRGQQTDLGTLFSVGGCLHRRLCELSGRSTCGLLLVLPGPLGVLCLVFQALSPEVYLCCNRSLASKQASGRGYGAFYRNSGPMVYLKSPGLLQGLQTGVAVLCGRGWGPQSRSKNTCAVPEANIQHGIVVWMVGRELVVWGTWENEVLCLTLRWSWVSSAGSADIAVGAKCSSLFSSARSTVFLQVRNVGF